MTALLSGLALLAGLVALVGTQPAAAGPVDPGWVATGPDSTFETLEDGSGAAAEMVYNGNGLGDGVSWDFTTQATDAGATGDIRVPWTWEGLHAWFQVRVQLDLIVNGVVRQTIVNPPLTDCCESPSNGFLIGGIATFPDAWVGPGDRYGFRLTGGNSDYNNFINGRFTLSNKPYLDRTIGQDNRQWLGASELPGSVTSRQLQEPGEARWFKIPVVPGQQVTVNLTGEEGAGGTPPQLPKDYDLAVYGDIQTAFTRLSTESDLTQLAGAAAATAPGDGSTESAYDPEISTVPTSIDTLPSTTFAPRIYAPRIYAPRIYAPRIYAPRIYAPRIYAPRIYAPGGYYAELEADPKFRDAFTAAQNQSLLGVSANTGNQAEIVSVNSGSTDGFLYVRVQGHDDQVHDALTAFKLTYTVSGEQACVGLDDFDSVPSILGSGTTYSTVVVTDTSMLGLTDGSAAESDYLDALGDLAAATGGTVVDLDGSERIQRLQDQVRAKARCPYAMNLVAREAKTIVDSYRGPSSKYVVIAGGDEVVPFFRYPDTSGLGQESQFEDEIDLLDDSAARASLRSDQVLSQDAYGARSEVTIAGATVPVADLAVGRLVKTPDEIVATVRHYLEDLVGGTLPEPQSSLVTGYDFLEDAARGVQAEFASAVPGGRHDELIEASGTPHQDSWSADDLREKLLGGERHDLVYLAGHFSANDTLAADFDQTNTLAAVELDPVDAEGNPTGVAGHLTDTLVLSAGCHSGYNIVDGAAVPDVTNTYDWTQAMARQQAVLIGGTGYQYGDTDFLEYSERLYLGIAQRLREGDPSAADPAPVAIGKALTLAKQDYLASLSSLPGIDQKAVLQATLYGLPMTGFDAPGRALPPRKTSTVSPTPAGSGPGAGFSLQVADQTFDTTSTEKYKASESASDYYGREIAHQWLQGKDGVTVQPGAPALPKQVENVSAETSSGADLVLRGVGLRSGSYTDESGVLPLTGAPAIEGATANSTFDSPVFFPQRLLAANYFGTLGDSGRTSLILTPGQYANDESADATDLNVQRAFGSMGVRLFYTGADVPKVGNSDPAMAAPPGISDVNATVAGSVVTFRARVAGDPAAGVQQVWVTWTGGPDGDGHGTWASVDLVQQENDSTLWTGTLDLAGKGVDWQDVSFLVQAANGVGAVSLDTADGAGYAVSPADDGRGFLELVTGPRTPSSPFGVTAKVTGAGSALQGRTVTFTVSRDGNVLGDGGGLTDSDGLLVATIDEATPAGRVQLLANLYDLEGQLVMSRTLDVVLDGLEISTASWLATRAGTAFEVPLTATVIHKGSGPVAGVPVTFRLLSSATGAGATFPGGLTTAVAKTGPDGVATAPPVTAGATVGAFRASVAADGADTLTVPMAAQYAWTPFSDPVDGSGPTSRNPNATLPVAAAALLADGTRLSDSAAAALVQAGRVQLRWREPTGSAWSTKSGLVSYDAAENVFRANVKSPHLGLAKGKTYEVQLRVLPAVDDPRPDGSELQSDFDLGHRGFLLSLR